MKRRALLGIAAAATTAGHAGCLDSGGDDETPTGTDDRDDAGTETDDRDGTDTPTETENGTPGEPRLVEEDVEIKSVECGSGEDHWEVDVDDGVVTVDGGIGGNNGCYSARIASAEYDGDEDVLRTTIESYDDSRDGETACMECIVDVYYRATYTFEDGEPGDVEVQHDGLEG